VELQLAECVVVCGIACMLWLHACAWVERLCKIRLFCAKCRDSLLPLRRGVAAGGACGYMYMYCIAAPSQCKHRPDRPHNANNALTTLTMQTAP
jgi:hypothetical protein